MKLMLQIAGGIFLGTVSAALVIAVTANSIMSYEFEIGMQQAAAPATEKVWIPGQPIQTCMHGKRVLNAAVLKCREGYFMTVIKKK